MITHSKAAEAHLRVQKLVEAVQAVEQRAAKPGANLFTRAYAEAKRRETYEAIVSASAQARWAFWRIPNA